MANATIFTLVLVSTLSQPSAKADCMASASVFALNNDDVKMQMFRPFGMIAQYAFIRPVR